MNVQVQAAVLSRHAVKGTLTGCATCTTPCTPACGANLQLGPIDNDVLVKDVPSVARLMLSARWLYPFLIRSPRPSAVFPIAVVECTSLRVYMPFADGATKFWGIIGKIKVGTDSPVVYDIFAVGLASDFPAFAYDTKTVIRNVPPW